MNISSLVLIVLLAVNPAPYALETAQPEQTDTEKAIRLFIAEYYKGNSEFVKSFLDKYWNPGNRNDIYIRAFANTAEKAFVKHVDIIFSEDAEDNDAPLIITAHITGTRNSDRFISTFVFTVMGGKIVKLLPMEKSESRFDGSNLVH